MTPDIAIILVATDFGPTSTLAVDYAAGLARQLEARLRVLHVVQDPYPSGSGWELYVRDAGAIRERLDEDARAAMTRVLTPLLASGLPVISELRHGSPTEAILEAAEDCAADLIVVGTHGRSGVSHLLMGSVAERVVRQAGCPVLAVRQPCASERKAIAVPATASV